MMDLRDLTHRAWRWPLYSRARAVTVLAAVVVIVAVAPRIGGGSTPPPAEAAAPSTTATTQTDQPTDSNPVQTEPTPATDPAEHPADPPSVATTATAEGSTDPAHNTAPPSQGNDPAEPAPAHTAPHSAAARPGPGTATASSSGTSAHDQAGDIPGPPSLLPAPVDFATPEAVASRWLQVWCWIPADGAANANLSRSVAWMTSAGRDDDQTRRVTAESWARTKDAGLSTACGPVTAQQPISAPQQPTVRWVEVTAQQTVYDTTDRIIERRQISQTRKVIKNATGRWLVDVEVQAG